ncbi:MAG: hypothetical protein COA99_17635 [Moraxellaceae bacterium]|nr:MAG: hypothetical protein COA99_17635 [Moraxellaceae bacterium]
MKIFTKLIIFITLLMLSSQSIASKCGAIIYIENKLDNDVDIVLKSFFSSFFGFSPEKNDTEDSDVFGFNTRVKTITIKASKKDKVAVTYFCDDLWVNYKVLQNQQSGQINWENDEREIVIK